MSNPTTPFGWQMPTATDLVTDLPADFEVFGQAVATSMADLLGGTTGQILAKNSNTDMDFVWIANDQGDITGITASSPLTGGGTSGAVTIGILNGTTSNLGAVQLSDSTSSTSTTLAATANAVKQAYDLADAAIAKSTLTTAGDVLYRNATVPVRLGIGTAGQVLTVNSGATAPEWATPSSAFVGCKVYKSTSQTVSAISTYTALTWDAESFDTNGFHDNSTNNSRITIPTGKSGKYLFNFTAAVSTSQVKRIGWYKNGSRIEIGITTSPNYTGGTTLSLTENLTAGDYIEVFVWNDSSTVYYSTADFTQIVTSLTATYLGA